MPGERIVIDGLWRCLCPSVDAKALSKALQQPLVLPIRTPSIFDRAHGAYAGPACTRSYRTETMPERVLNKASNLLKMPPRIHRKPTSVVRHPNKRRSRAQDAYERYFDRMAKRLPEIPRALFTGTPPSDSELDRIDTSTLLRALQELLAVQWQYHCIVAIVEHLVAKRGMKPDAFLYECLIKVNVDPKYGSAEIVGNLLEEMVSTGCLPNSAVYHGVLEVLAVHPDYVLRTKVLRDMKQAWIEPTFQGLVAVTVGLLRDGQYELALERLEALNAGDMDVPPWLYDIFIYTFTNTGMHAEALMIVQHRLRDPELGVAGNMWYALLEAFSRDFYYDGVSYIWERKVAPAILVPSDGMVLDVLNTAARNGDAALAAEALDMLSKRGKKLELHHFEPLMEIHAREHDLKRAFLTLGLMAKAGLQPDSSSTREIYAVLRESTEKTEEAIAILLENGVNDQIPMAAFNVVLEAKLQHEGFKSGLDTYRSVRRICASPPNLATFHLLLSQCTLLKSLQFILAEMEGFSVKPDSYVYNRTLLICTLNPQYEHAFRYLDLAKSRAIDGEVGDWWMDRDTALALIRRCILAEDGRVQGSLRPARRGAWIQSSRMFAT
ncbi:pentatricopeptide repeat-containing protein- mitochondrial [Apiospora saccharicola]